MALTEVAPTVPFPHRIRLLRGAELAVLFGGLPCLLARTLPPRGIIPALWVIALTAFLALRLSPGFDRDHLTSWNHWRREVPPMLLQFLVAALLLGIALYAYRPKLLFRFPLNNPWGWLLVMVSYPWISVYPQAILYRALYAHRYGPVFPTRFLGRLAGAVFFSLAHLPFGNGWALGFTFIGGYLFLGTYERTGSLPLSCFEHALYGNFLFTIGWGAYLYHGGTQALLTTG